MLTFMIAYLIVWLAVLAYLVRLGGEQRRLRRTADALQAQFAETATVATARCIENGLMGLRRPSLRDGARRPHPTRRSIQDRTMKIAIILLCAALAAVSPPAVAGTIQGTVVNTSSGSPVPCQVAVILQVQVKRELVPYRDVVSDKQGRFSFQRLPVGDGVVYQAGATRHGVFYPGPRIRLTDRQPTAYTGLSVCDAVAGPNPLVLKKMDVTIRPETGLLKVTESLLLENPSHTCYVGEAAHDGADPVTLGAFHPARFRADDLRPGVLRTAVRHGQ